MLDRIKQIPARIAEMWKKLTKRQRVVTVSSIGAVLLTLIILIVLLNRVQYDKLTTFETTAGAKEAMEILATENIPNRLEDDMLTVSVDVTRKQDAVLALTNSDTSSEMTLAMLEDNDLSTTGDDKERKSHLYMQSRVSSKLTTIEGIDDATVIYFPEDNRSSILTPSAEICCSVFLEINENFNADKTPVSVATAVAFAIGNETTDKIKVIDQYGHLLFGGEEEDEDVQDLNTNLAYKKAVEKWYKDKLFELAIKNDYTDAEIVASLSVNCDKVSQIFTEYLPADGQEQGVFDEYIKISSESTGGSGDVPGTDSNDETDYYIQTSSTGKSSYDENRIKYRPSERVTETLKEWGVIDNALSSLGITLTRIKEISEESLEKSGALDEMSFDEYVEANSGMTELEVPEALYELFSDASGIPASKIKITAYERPFYIGKEIVESNTSLYLEILLAVLIIGLLLFVVFRAMKPEEIIETEPELSVERLLATTKENQSLEDIEFGDKSETRKLIEKYIDENPEAVAALLRNWLNDDGWE